MSRTYHHTFPAIRKVRHNYSALFNNTEDKAKLLYNKDMKFRAFVLSWNSDSVELMGWSLTDFYNAYNKGAVQLSLF